MSNEIISFIKNSKYENFDKLVIDEAKKCLLDTVGSCIAGSSTKLSRIINDFSKKYYKGDDANSFVHGTKMSQLGALFVSAMSIDAFDMHDGHVLTKGHVGVSVISAALLIHCEKNITGKELLANIVIGYEIATRAGMALHNSVDDYHTSGAWNSLGVCAIACRVLNLNEEEIKHALGICEFYAPRSQMMKIIDAPTMLKDGSGFGSFVGLKAALLAQAGFTGAPSLLLFSKKNRKLLGKFIRKV
ncbi:MmgE/PrpD family protein [Sulfurospirillum sp.]|nr:MmgE/PrpD family protein [Sulfurospirillum sp.]